MKRISMLFFPMTLLVALATLASSCTSLQRSAASGYLYRDADPNLSRERRSEERLASAKEMGWDTQDLDDDRAEALDRRVSVKKAERTLEGKREREQYYRNKPYMRNDRERLEFLGIDSFEARARWLNAKNIGGPTTSHPPEIQSLVDINDITVGMTKQAVRDSWGEPELVEVAGNPMYGNERWHFTEQTQSAEGYHSQKRIVYFESGRVIGWESL